MTSLQRPLRAALPVAMLGAAFLAVSSAALAQTYPSKPIEIVVPYPPGGSIDLTARIVGPKLSERLGQQIIVLNKPGASGQIGVDEVARSAPDGHRIVLASPGAVAINMHFRPMPYDPLKDLVPVTLTATVPTALAVPASLPISNFKEFVAYMKANSGKTSFSVSGLGSQTHLSGEMLKARTGIDMQAVPYKGTQPATEAIASGQVQAGISDLSTLTPLQDAKKVRIIGVVDPQRTKLAPEIPTIAESGLPGFAATGWVAMFVPAATPKDVIARLNKEMDAILREPDVVQKLAQAGMEAMPLSVDAALAFHREEVRKWGEVIKTANIKLEN